ncbi:unnamed protein product [Closterium sp. Naga37s-1]|nr:unnamed protein product [Closterium sp. Naga37s-1]
MPGNELWGPLPPAADLFAPRSLASLPTHSPHVASDLRSNYLTGNVPQVPAGRNIDFKFFTNCFHASAGASADTLLGDENPRSTTDCTRFYSNLDQGRPPTPALASTSPARPPTSNTIAASSPFPPTSPSPTPSPTPSTPSASSSTSLTKPSHNLRPPALLPVAAFLLALLAAAMA